MGVSLERVQYKFASIIGELCSEPVVLSQFAVWLDLRLAEYKSKGTISLDCSGSRPEPSWMKGVIPPTPHHTTVPPHRLIGAAWERTARQQHVGSPSPARSLITAHSNSHTNIQEVSLHDEDRLCDNSASEDRLSPDVLVKQEPVDLQSEVVPVNLHDNFSTVYVNNSPRKRVHLVRDPFSVDTVKRQKHSNSSQPNSSLCRNPLSNQSLMSVIGGGNIDSFIDNGEPSQRGENSNSLELFQGFVAVGGTSAESMPETGEDMSNDDPSWEWRAGDRLSTASPSQRTNDNKLVLPGQECSICGYFSTKPYNIKRHMLKHRPDMKFKCPYCFHGFIDKYQLTNHIKRKHAGEITEIPLEENCSFASN